VTVTKVEKVFATADAPEMNSNRVIFGIKQITEEVLSEKFSICQDGYANHCRNC